MTRLEWVDGTEPDPEFEIRQFDSVGTFRYRGDLVRPARLSAADEWNPVTGTPYEVRWRWAPYGPIHVRRCRVEPYSAIDGATNG